MWKSLHLLSHWIIYLQCTNRWFWLYHHLLRRKSFSRNNILFDCVICHYNCQAKPCSCLSNDTIEAIRKAVMGISVYFLNWSTVIEPNHFPTITHSNVIFSLLPELSELTRNWPQPLFRVICMSIFSSRSPWSRL